jgi:hypothetical protein
LLSFQQKNASGRRLTVNALIFNNLKMTLKRRFPMKLNEFFPVAVSLVATVSVVSIGAPARAAGPLDAGGEIDLVGIGNAFYTQNAIAFANGPQGAPSTTGLANITNATGAFASAVPPFTSPVKLFGLYSPTVFSDNVPYKGLATELIDFGNGTTYTANSFERSVNPANGAVTLDFGGFFQTGGNTYNSTLALFTGQLSKPIASTPIVSSLSAIDPTTAGTSSYTASLVVAPTPTTVPESSTLVGTLFFGFIGAGAFLKRRYASVR